MAALVAPACSTARELDNVAPYTATPDGATPTDPVGASSTATEGVTSVGADGDGYAVCWTAPAAGTASTELELTDQTTAFGLEQALIGMRGHAAAWGDVDGDGIPDLAFGTFATARPEVYTVRGADGPSPDVVLTGTGSGFTPARSLPEQYGRTSGAAMVDLDGDGDLDLVLARNINARGGGVPTTVFANDGSAFSAVDSGIDPHLSGRSVGVLDYDGDGLLDLLILEDRYSGGSSRLYRNLGGLRFEDTTAPAGLPTDIHGLGLAVGDLNQDFVSDVFVAGSNRLFIGTGSGFTEAAGAIPVWETFGPEDDVSGAAIADVNRDGALDLLVGHHYNSTLSRGGPVPVRLYLNRTTQAGDPPTFEDVTERSGLAGLPTKAPHVELADLNNDGLVDVLTTASAAGGASPAVFVNDGLDDGVPRFSVPAGLGDAQYWVTGPTADVDRNGTLDLLAVEWDPALPSILFINETAGGHWLEVSVNDPIDGIGSRVEVFEPGRGGDPAALLGSREITATVGYTAGIELHAHFGLGDRTTVDVTVTGPGGAEVRTLAKVAADGHIRVGGCA